MERKQIQSDYIVPILYFEIKLYRCLLSPEVKCARLLS